MKFVHVADLHLGKMIHQTSLLEIQKELLKQLLEYMNENSIHLLIVAGDVYDRAIPSQEAVNVLDEFLSDALLKYHIKVMMISGNHDSSDRMNFASSILKNAGLHIETYIHKKIHFYELENVRFYMLPFMKPSVIRNIFDCDVHTYQEAIEYYLSKQDIDKNYKNILITHQFVGKNSIVSDSEVALSVGGSEIIDDSLFDDFDYVALGHLHASQKISRETLRYSGSLMRYSFDEVKQKKSIVIVDTDDMSISLHELSPSQNLEKYEGNFEYFMDPSSIDKKDDYLSFVLTDDSLIPHAMEQLRSLYPNLLQITYSHLMNTEYDFKYKDLESLHNISEDQLFDDFYKEVKNQDLNDRQKEIIKELLEKAGE